MKWKIGNVEINNRIVLAPMAGVTDSSFRTICKNNGAGLVYSEMISAMGITHDSKKTIKLLSFKESERPISIQIFGSDVNSFVESARFIEKNIHPDIIDINMGCPVPKVALKSQAGSALLKDPDKIYEIVKKVVDSTNTPITVKIRSGWDEKSINAISVAKKIEQAGASAICIHARTRSQGYSGKANWDIIKEIKENVNIPVIGNGDIETIHDAKKMLEYTKCDATMIGRAALGNPWFIKECVEYVENNKVIEKPTSKQKLEMILTHYNMLKNEIDAKTALLQIRTHALWYLKGIPESKELKRKIVTISSEEELFTLVKDFIDKTSEN